MRKRIFILFVLISVISLSFTWAATLKKVNFNEAKKVANNWLNKEMSLLKKIGIEGIRWQVISSEEIKEKGVTVGYNFNLYPHGHVFISAYHFLPPVKIYSFSSSLEKSDLLPLIKTIYYQMIKKSEEMNEDRFQKITSRNRVAWKELLRKNNESGIMESKIGAIIKGPIVKTHWNQNYPYNKYSPVIQGQRSYAGCVATSVSQIMKYWNYPPKGQGSHSYVTDTHRVRVSADFNHTYDWNNMPNSISAGSPSVQINAISKLIYDVGVSVDMDFTPSGSGAYPDDIPKSLTTYFKYSTNVKYTEYDDYRDVHAWFNVIRNEIDAIIPRPVNLAIYSDNGGHSVVVDGYKINGSNEYFHINMGWSGTYDGYYKPNGIREYNKIEWESAIINIYPSELPNAPKPPIGIKAVRTTKTFLLYNLYYDTITWKASPTGDKNLTEYRVYERVYDGNRVTDEKMVAVVKVNQPKYIIIPKGVERTKAAYSVTAVGKNGIESIKPTFVIVK